MWKIVPERDLTPKEYARYRAVCNKVALNPRHVIAEFVKMPLRYTADAVLTAAAYITMLFKVPLGEKGVRDNYPR